MGQRCIHSRHTGSTRATGVWCDMISETSTPQGEHEVSRHGSGRALTAYQSSTRSRSREDTCAGQT